VFVGDALVETTDLWITAVGPESQGLGTDIVNQLLNQGYRAFLDGDAATARAVFADITRRFPTSAAAHNNLAFLALSSGDHHAALNGFHRAEELGYSDRWLLRPNLSCCLYLAGDLPAARAGFEEAMRTETPSEGVLFAIGANELAAIRVKAPLDYIALMALNAGWSALRTGELEDARRLQGTAEAGRLSFGHDQPSQVVFGKSLGEFSEALSGKADAST
jgi:tetratricopeptide (TPR) repeat protein